MKDELEAGVESGAPIWPVFGDLMSVVLGAMVLVLVGVVAMQLQLSNRLEEEIQQRQAETQRRQTLEQALAQPLAEGRVTLVDGRIGISGSVLFALNSDQLQDEGQEVLQSLVAPLSEYLHANDQALMISGFTDDQPIHIDNRRFADNWELSAQRALTVTRALVEAGIPSSRVFAAAFGAEQPISSNADEAGRARNRRVEISPVPHPSMAEPLPRGSLSPLKQGASTTQDLSAMQSSSAMGNLSGTQSSSAGQSSSITQSSSARQTLSAMQSSSLTQSSSARRDAPATQNASK